MFWTNAVGKDPKRKFRWIFMNNHIPVYTCKKVTKPSWTMDAVEHRYLNHTFKYPGGIKWEAVTLTLVDPLQPDASATLMSILEAGGYHPPSDANDTSTMSKERAVAALGMVEIQQIDSNGASVEKWTLVNAWVKSAKFGELDYEADELTELELEIEYDYAYMDTQGSAQSPIPGNHFPTNVMG